MTVSKMFAESMFRALDAEEDEPLVVILVSFLSSAEYFPML